MGTWSTEEVQYAMEMKVTVEKCVLTTLVATSLISTVVRASWHSFAVV